MTMKKLYSKLFLLALALLSLSCMKEQVVDFTLDTDVLEIGPEGGVHTLNVNVGESWVASTQQPWITVSPANGRGSVECKVLIDSTLKWNESREGEVFITTRSSESRSFKIVQKGYDYQIVMNNPEPVRIADYADYGKRSFQVRIKANVDFKVKIPSDAESWLKYKKSNLVLDRNARPREVVVDFDWETSYVPFERIAKVQFEPVKTVQMGRHDTLNIVQKAAPEIEIGTVRGDSLAILAIHRALGVWDPLETSERLENWSGIKVWKTKDERNGRVRSASFSAFTTKEPLPYVVQYLTAAEELSFYGNTNTFLLNNLDCGPYICKLTQLKRLRIGAYGLCSVHEDIKNLKNLEYLSLESNNFQRIPEVLTPENFPNLRALMLNGNVRYTVRDLGNDKRENIGGFVDEEGFPVRLLTWNKLDTLCLSYNYLQGELPSDEQIDSILLAAHGKVDYWRSNDPCIKDSIAVDNTFYEDHDIAKVMPSTIALSINLNRLYGELPQWLLYHPKLDLWIPESLVWFQDGVARNHTPAGFSNAPTNMKYYYDELFIYKKNNPKNFVEE
jgi:hypothetical protein